MMDPSSPPPPSSMDSSSLQQQQQQQQQQQSTTRRQRQRITENNNNNNYYYPYRDDPSAPPSSRLESFTPGGYGPLHANADTTEYYDNDLKKQQTKTCYSVVLSCWNQCHAYCQPTTTSTSLTNSNNNHHNIHSDYYLYYTDEFNDLSYNCTLGTDDTDGIWLNQSDPAGTIMSCLVWFLIGYSALTMTLLAQTGGIPTWSSIAYSITASLALATHAKTTLTDPGSVPASAVPTEEQRRQLYNNTTTTTSPQAANQNNHKLSMCSQCQTFKPPGSHHCRICNRCIARMDHHCPWMNNCIGAGNLKHFCLFLLYTWLCSVLSLTIMGYNYFFCTDVDICVFNLLLTQLVRIMTLLSLGAFLFTSSMLMNVVYGIMTGIGTIDRLKKKANGTLLDSTEESIPLEHIFGIAPYYTWLFPIDPIFPDYDAIMGYATPQRYLREQMRAAAAATNNNNEHNYPHNIPESVYSSYNDDDGQHSLNTGTYPPLSLQHNQQQQHQHQQFLV